MSFYLAKYGVQTTFPLPIIKRGVVDFAVSADWTPATGDVKISKDGGDVANIDNIANIAIVGGTGGAHWRLTLTATEMQAAEIVVQVVDAATKAIEDQCLVIYTYGNASAKVKEDLSAGVAQTGDSYTIISDGTNGNAAIKTAVGAIAAVLSGITSLANWLRGLVRKDAMNSTAKTELNSGGGTYDETTDSQEAIRDTAPMGTAMRGTDGANTIAPATPTNVTDAQAAILTALRTTLCIAWGTASYKATGTQFEYAVAADSPPLTLNSNIIGRTVIITGISASDIAAVARISEHGLGAPDLFRVESLPAGLVDEETVGFYILATDGLAADSLEDIKGTGFVKDTNSLVNVSASTPVNLTVQGKRITLE